MKSIVYHKIKKFDRNYKFDKFLILMILKTNKILKKNITLSIVKNLISLENLKHKIVFIFDDGLKIHYDFVFPQLKKIK